MIQQCPAGPSFTQGVTVVSSAGTAVDDQPSE